MNADDGVGTSIELLHLLFKTEQSKKCFREGPSTDFAMRKLKGKQNRPHYEDQCHTKSLQFKSYDLSRIRLQHIPENLDLHSWLMKALEHCFPSVQNSQTGIACHRAGRLIGLTVIYLNSLHNYL